MEKGQHLLTSFSYWFWIFFFFFPLGYFLLWFCKLTQNICAMTWGIMTALDQNLRTTWMKDNFSKRTRSALALVKQIEWKRFVQTGASNRRKLSETALTLWQTPLLSETSKLPRANRCRRGSYASTKRSSGFGENLGGTWSSSLSWLGVAWGEWGTGERAPRLA